MGPIENELARHSFSTNTIQDDMLSFMIINPLNEIGNSMEDSNGKWTVKSFTGEAQWYQVNVSNNLIQNCTCPNFASRQIPCKHTHLLKRFIGLDFAYTVQRENNHLQLQRSLASEHEVAVVNEEVENETNTVVVGGRNNSVWLQRIMAQNTTLHHQREDLEQLMDVPGIDEAELQVISGLLGEAMNRIDTLRNANSSCFRNLNTQR
ncbi:hypothetical protein PHYBLDRAFT_142255 [Phycomyces blakesleeanus NRRL 1555(-)]|uniref:SWIM-type domain-containing protein n=1 Tax=Phycomyces blakesleeanus (strain ATCC 8743b / DSM 1359 / FGSC 10004 / NBRC 33097 / NRRL 1555) TaxID=763407 RepID=A0A167NWG6_PHYB8|nr:hypothetical protein PHYBLDRAFT_142255 [Phycomyces blakesleeanus NRRL 1555(-)]OAD76746.1 hypothetical protein PHYBLDRAFT_142255 [Phycomyces blakesleeanus NRRL 1555(-)]|eukprot:XP_018294786.1 hypothetical protein PHYBLDRAFT_142255 [Phycomyces blakesleeanus NRRL 1555(-)]